jgi:hypothetical protein
MITPQVSHKKTSQLSLLSFARNLKFSGEPHLSQPVLFYLSIRLSWA